MRITSIFLSFAISGIMGANCETLGFRSKICEVNTVNELQNSLAEIDDHTLVLFDCDDVLFCNSDAALQRGRLPQVIDFAKNNQTPVDEILPKITRSANKELVQEGMPTTVDWLQSNKIPVFTLTQCTSDEDVRKEREEKLREFKFDFTKTLPTELYHRLEVNPESLQLKPFQTHVTPPVYDSGIIYCGSAPKGEVLMSFLDWIYSLDEKNPFSCSRTDLHIILIDDAKRNLTDTANACEKMNVKQFTGLHYTAVDKPSHAKDLEENVVSLQLDTLLTRRSWLNDRDATFYSALIGF